MPIPEADVDAVLAYCRRKTADFDPTWSVVRADADADAVTITDVEYGHAGAVAVAVTVAQLRYCAPDHLWTLYWSDAEGVFHEFDVAPQMDVRDMLDVIDEDPAQVFWG